MIIKILLIFSTFLLLFKYRVYSSFGINKVNDKIIGENEGNLSISAIELISYFLGFLALIGVIWIIKSGFQILTSAGDDEKVKNAKKSILFSLLGLFIIWGAYALISGITNGLNSID